MADKHEVWAEVDLSAIRHNVEQVRAFVGDNVRIMAVVKADAYGHGAVETSKAILEAGADCLAVTRLREAARLREAQIECPILVFGSIQPDKASIATDLGVELTVCTTGLVTALGLAAAKARREIGVHLKIDTGMGRLGVLPEDVPELVRLIAATEYMNLAGTYTHLATAAESDLGPAADQLRRFHAAIHAIRLEFRDAGTVHAANSAAILRMPEAHFDMVRPGTIIYGQYPSKHVPRTLDLADTWQLKARISFIKTVPAGFPIGYGGEFVSKRESRIAVIPVGWADGLSLIPESVARASVLKLAAARLGRRPTVQMTIRDRKAPVVGRIAMQMCSADVTDIPDAQIGDEVIIPARRVTTSPLIPRVYVP